MNEEVLQAINVLEDTIYNLKELIKLIDNINELSFLKNALKIALDGLIKRGNLLEKLSDFNRQIASFADLDEDTRRNWTYKVGGRKTNFNDLLKKSRKVSVDAFIYCDLDFYFSYTQKLLIINKMFFFDSSRKKLTKNEYNENDIINLILR